MPKELQNGGFTYQSSDETVATVTKKGNIKGESLGECTVTIISKKDSSAMAEVPVRVVKPVKTIEISVPNTTIGVGQTMQIKCGFAPEDATIQTVTYRSSNEKAATVDENGLVTALARGTSTITVKSTVGGAKAQIKLTVQQLPESITFKQDEYVVALGRKLKFNIGVHPSNANNRKVDWHVSDPEIAAFDKEGTLRALKDGTVTVTATSQADPSVSGTVVVRCVQPITGISFDQMVYDMGVGESVQLHPILAPADATPAVAYRSKNAHICSVDENGLVTGLMGGITSVNVVSKQDEDIQQTVTIRVIVPIEGVAVDQKGVRLDVGEHIFGNVKIRPLDATIKDMEWTSSDELVATVTNTSNRPRIEGHAWGRCTITGKTVMGDFTASINVNVGALHEALTLQNASVKNGQVFVTLVNHSNMHMSKATIAFDGSTANGSEEMQSAVIALDLAPGATSKPVAVPFEGMQVKRGSVSVCAWESDTGYYANNDQLKNSYRISSGLQVWKPVR